MTQASSQGPMSRFLGTLTGAEQLRLEKDRLEAFLAAVPGEYCGFAKDGSVIYSAGFLALLGLEKLENIHDIQNALSTGDAAALEGMFIRLQEDEKKFSIDVETQDKKNIRISGSRGSALSGKERFDIIWIEDITEDNKKFLTLEKERDQSQQEIEKLQNTLDNIPRAVWIRDAQSNLIWCNKAYGKVVSNVTEKILAEQLEIIISAKNKGKVISIKQMAQDALKTGQPQKQNCHLIAAGKRHYVEITESPLPGSNYTFGMILDHTKEEELVTELKRYVSANTTLLEQLRSAIGIFNADQELEFFNSAFSQLWGLEDQWLHSRPKLGDILEKLRETRHLPEQADFRNYKKSWLDMFTRLIDPHEDMLYLPNGTALRMLIVPHPMGGLMMTFEDVTSRLELESSYNTLIAVQKETLDNLAEGVVVYGSDGRLKLCNPSFAKLWGLHPEDLEGQPHITKLVERMIGRFDLEKYPDKREYLISHGIERKVQEGRCICIDGTLVEFTTVPLPDGGVMVSYFDVTDAAQVEQALREKNAALEAAEELKTDFLANVSYQLRTPLNAIMGFAEILDNQYFGDLNDKQKEYSTGIQDAGGKLVRLIDDILDLSTIEAGYLDLAMNEFNPKETLESIHELTTEWARKQKINVTLDCADNIGLLIADERRIKQVLLNLMQNAINFTPENGKITIAAKRLDDVMEFSVSDTGIGISKADLQRVFEPFERAVIEHRADMSSTALSRGAGLGLSLVKNIVELHGGSVSIESEEDKGTTVKLSLPLTPVLEPIL
ncbi:MAG TPA: PAS-domain containing protein [Alphaproteobacteria bacterium]|nr:PAS-domain containing protein [Alphaproteobacteria bacterium]